MAKQTVTYKTDFNERLKQVSFHGEDTYPLYVQITFMRKTYYFKSYYFELLSSPRFSLTVAGITEGPSIQDAIEMELEVCKFIIERHPDDFSLDLFKKEYAFYSKDLCEIMENAFLDYLFVFFNDEGASTFATTIAIGGRYRIAFELVRDMKRVLSKPVYEKLIENAFFYAPPYLIIYGFMNQLKRWPLLCLTVMEWESEIIQAKFIDYLRQNHANRKPEEVKAQIQKWIEAIKNYQ